MQSRLLKRAYGWDQEGVMYDAERENTRDKQDQVKSPLEIPKNTFAISPDHSLSKTEEELIQEAHTTMNPVLLPKKASPESVIEQAQKELQHSDVTTTPEFKAWFRGSKVVDANGKPLRVFHGSVHEFDTFDITRGDKEGYHGPNLYFTSRVEDSNRNYATISGPDLKNKIDRLAEALIAEWDDENVPEYADMSWGEKFEKASAIAAKSLVGHGGATYVCYLRIEKPIIIDGHKSTQFSGKFNYRSEDKPFTGQLRVIWDALYSIYSGGVDGLIEVLADGVNAHDLETWVRANTAIDDYGDYLNPGSVLAGLYQKLGFDGIIMQKADQTFKNMGMPAGTTHYICFSKYQVKSAIGNIGKFNPRSPKLQASKR